MRGSSAAILLYKSFTRFLHNIPNIRLERRIINHATRSFRRTNKRYESSHLCDALSRLPSVVYAPRADWRRMTYQWVENSYHAPVCRVTLAKVAVVVSSARLFDLRADG